MNLLLTVLDSLSWPEAFAMVGSIAAPCAAIAVIVWATTRPGR